MQHMVWALMHILVQAKQTWKRNSVAGSGGPTVPACRLGGGCVKKDAAHLCTGTERIMRTIYKAVAPQAAACRLESLEQLLVSKLLGTAMHFEAFTHAVKCHQMHSGLLGNARTFP